MNIISGLIAAHKLQSLKNGNSVYLSKAEIINLTLNLPDARRNLSQEDFRQIFILFRLVERNKTKMLIKNIDQYDQIAADLISCFDEIAPFEKYAGPESIDSYVLISKVREKREERNNDF